MSQLLTHFSIPWRIHNPVPLKHHTETAFIVLLGLVIAVFGVLTSLLPHIPAGLLYWLVLFALSIAYPLSLQSFFRQNRADYEFRFLHWMPAVMLVLWLIVDIAAAYSTIGLILWLGFTYIWALPFVLFSFFLLALFVLSVIRRSRVRMVLLTGMLILFAALGYLADARKWNATLQARIYPDSRAVHFIAGQYDRLRARLGIPDADRRDLAMVPPAEKTVTGSIDIASSLPPLYNMPGPDKDVIKSQQEREKLAAMNRRVHRLPRSGPEDMGALAIGLVAIYSGVLHSRAKKRV